MVSRSAFMRTLRGESFKVVVWCETDPVDDDGSMSSAGRVCPLAVLMERLGCLVGERTAINCTKSGGGLLVCGSFRCDGGFAA